MSLRICKVKNEPPTWAGRTARRIVYDRAQMCLCPYGKFLVVSLSRRLNLPYGVFFGICAHLSVFDPVRESFLLFAGRRAGVLHTKTMDQDPSSQPLRVDSVASLGRAVRQARKLNQLGQLRLAGLSGVGVRFLSELERGKPSCEIGKILEVLNSLGLEVWLEPRAPQR